MSVELDRAEVAARAQHRQRPHDRPFNCARDSRRASRPALARSETLLSLAPSTTKNVSSSVEATRNAVALELFFSFNKFVIVCLAFGGVAERDDRLPPSYAFRAFSLLCRPRIRGTVYCTGACIKYNNVVNTSLVCGEAGYLCAPAATALRAASYDLLPTRHSSIIPIGLCNVPNNRRWNIHIFFSQKLLKCQYILNDKYIMCNKKFNRIIFLFSLKKIK